jgi:hypothetical protein
MNDKTELIMNYKSTVGNIISWMFGIVFFAIGIINTFWGNDPGFGLFIIILSFVYFPPVNVLIRKMIGFSIPLIAKIILGIFIIWASVGVGELFDKIEIMLRDF